ncbi:Transcription initiation factor tfiid subunit [Thalictrum thalictroides]|uniref:Transcription initiation factor tfiid subunit n=1 Tax=Thalictrum thalictroides TaxID=46969 RepID=A0A7J6WQD1_THATH|nr:Transcription initiation factor tfiid subunit [Thalictrum thalictroides]
MSIVPKETIEVIAQSIGINNLSPDVALALAPDVEYRVREIMQEAIKCMRHSKRTILTADDVDSALNLRNVEPIYGFASGDPLRFKRAVGHKDLFYIDDKDVEFKDVIEAPIPKAPLDTAVVAHWLAIEGVQPAIPENAPVEALVAPSDNRKSEHKEDGLPVEIKLPIKHVLSRELQLHQLMPSVITCLVAKRLGKRFSDNHWELRNFTASLVASICKRFGHVYHNLQPRVTRTMLHAFLDPTKALTQHYGAIQGLAALGPSVIRLLILPNLQPYLQLLEPEMLHEKQKNEMKRHEAWRVYGALLCAAGQCMYDRLKLFPGLLSPPARTIWKTNNRVVTTRPNKRKMSLDHLTQQPPLKKVMSEGMMGATMQTDMQAVTDGFPAASGNAIMAPSSSLRQITNESNSRGSTSRKEKSEGRLPKMSVALAQAWKEDMDAGHLLASLFEFFGESILPFTPSAELSFFL